MPGGSGQVLLSVDTPDGRIAVEQLGASASPSTVVFLHGLTANRTTWRPVARLLGEKHRLLLVDSLARGDSDPAPRARFDLEAEAERLAATLRECDVDGPILAGHSQGAAIAVASADRTRARGLFLASPVTPDLTRPTVLERLGSPIARGLVPRVAGLFRRPLTRYMLVRRVFTGEVGLPADAVERYAAPWGHADRARSLPAVLADWDPGELRRWAAPLEIPVRVVSGDSDRRIPPVLAAAWSAKLNGRFSLFPGCGHGLPEEFPSETAAALVGLIEAVT